MRLQLIHGDARDFVRPANSVVVSDPPFNIGRRYNDFNDRIPEADYWRMLLDTMQPPCVIVHYPEQVFRFAAELSQLPSRTVAWVYNSNTRRQWRMIAWFGIAPDFSKGSQPYKNPTDKRIKARIAAGKSAGLYDWWNVNQVKNVSKQHSHPCQMPLVVMRNVITITPGEHIIDPYMGTGTTGIAALEAGRRFTGIERDAGYFATAKSRLEAVWTS
jgi:hypothetical protein